MLKKNQEIELTCEALGAELEGVCRYEGQAVFVPGALPGEKLRGKVVRAEKRYAFARVEALREPSPEWREAPCRQYPAAGAARRCTCNTRRRCAPSGKRCTTA